MFPILLILSKNLLRLYPNIELRLIIISSKRALSLKNKYTLKYKIFNEVEDWCYDHKNFERADFYIRKNFLAVDNFLLKNNFKSGFVILIFLYKEKLKYRLIFSFNDKNEYFYLKQKKSRRIFF